jgi:hypothetical protein
MIDSLNHKSTVATDLDYDSLRQRFRLRLGQGYGAGQQVFMSYGAKSNDDLVMYYGFVEPDAAADVFEFGDMLAWLRERRGAMVNDDRVQTMYSKGLQDAVRCVAWRVWRGLLDLSVWGCEGCLTSGSVGWMDGWMDGWMNQPFERQLTGGRIAQPSTIHISYTHPPFPPQGLQDRAEGPGGGLQGTGRVARAAGLRRGAPGGERHHREHHPDAHVLDAGRVPGLGVRQGKF